MDIFTRIISVLLALGLLAAPTVSAAPPTQDGSIVIVAENVTNVVELEQFANRHVIDAPDSHPDTTAMATRHGVWLYDENGHIFDLLQFIPTILTNNTAWSNDGQRIATGNFQDGVTVFEFPSLEPVITLPDVSREIGYIAFSPDGKQLITSGNFYDHDFELWDIETGQRLGHFVGQTAYVIRAFFTDQGQQIVTAAADLKLRIWDTETAQIHAVISFDSPIYDTVLSPDERIAYVGLGGGRIAAASLIDHQILWQQTVEWDDVDNLGLPNDVNAVAISPDGDTLVVGTATGQLQSRDATTGDHLHSIGTFHAAISDVSFSPDGGTVYAFQHHLGIRDTHVYAYNAETTELIAAFEPNAAAPLSDSRFSTTASSVFSSENGHLAEFDTLTGERLHTFDHIPMSSLSTVHAINTDTILMAIVDQSSHKFPVKRYRMINLSDGTIRFEIAPTQSSNIAELSPDKQFLAIALWDGEIAIWDMFSGERLSTMTHGFQEMMSTSPAIRSLEWSPDGNQILVMFNSRVGQIVDVVTGEIVLGDVSLDANTKNLTWWNGRPVSIFYAGTEVRIADVETDEIYVAFGLESFVRQVAIAHHGQLLAFTTHIGEIGFVGMETGQILHQFQAHPDSIGHIEWSIDDSRLLTVGYDGTQRLWGIPDS